ncbi:MAG: very short patch repair endonuclease [Muribaculaceae bacterium]|nr:very short patch repair endonuclease [Muribaculaceae bacterium]
MSDVLTKEQRHRCMSNVKSKNTKPEIMVRKFLFSNGYRYRVNRKDLPGKPDIVLPKYKTVVFINGCFWHGHPKCKYATIPATNRDFWLAKINGNVERDKLTREKLSQLGWKVIDIWQCQLKPHEKETTLNQLISNLSNEK